MRVKNKLKEQKREIHYSSHSYGKPSFAGDSVTNDCEGRFCKCYVAHVHIHGWFEYYLDQNVGFFLVLWWCFFFFTGKSEDGFCIMNMLGDHFLGGSFFLSFIIYFFSLFFLNFPSFFLPSLFFWSICSYVPWWISMLWHCPLQLLTTYQTSWDTTLQTVCWTRHNQQGKQTLFQCQRGRSVV